MIRYFIKKTQREGETYIPELIRNKSCVSPAPCGYKLSAIVLALDIFLAVLDDYALVVFVNFDTHNVVDGSVFIVVVSDDIFDC